MLLVVFQLLCILSDLFVEVGLEDVTLFDGVGENLESVFILITAESALSLCIVLFELIELGLVESVLLNQGAVDLLHR